MTIKMAYQRSAPKEPATILFASIPFEYLADTAAAWAERGIRGFMLAHIMSNWDSDVWLSDGKRIVGEDNPLLQRTKRMNEVCREHTLNRNFIKVAFYSHLPDWFDDVGWSRLLENFRQAAVFAREGLFRGVAIDIEYISEIYELSWKDYQKPGYPVSELRGKSEERGAEIIRSMVDEYPGMEVLHLPQGPECYGPLATDLFRGMCVEMAERNAPGGLHLLTEETYTRTNPDWLLRYAQDLDALAEGILPEGPRSYWRKKCSISFGLWPLGYYRQILDGSGKFLGYGGKREKFGDKVIGSYGDKSENYSVDEFRRQLAISRMVCKRYVWIYCHGSTLWQLGKDQMARYHGSASDELPVVNNLDQYIDVIRRAEVLSDRAISAMARKIRDGVRVDFLASLGSPKAWNVIGPFDNPEGTGFSIQYPPERGIDLDASHQGASGEVKWETVRVSSTGFVNLRSAVHPHNYMCAYALAYARVPDSRDAVVLLGSDDGAKLWIDGKQVFALDVVRGAEPDQDRVPVRLRRGIVPVLLKVTNHRGAWGFYLRIVDEDGKAFKGLRWSLGKARP